MLSMGYTDVNKVALVPVLIDHTVRWGFQTVRRQTNKCSYK